MQQKVLVVNCGSSSVKFAVMVAQSGAVIAAGTAERLFSDAPLIKSSFADQAAKTQPMPAAAGHREAMIAVVELVQRLTINDDLIAVGHRVVHGGEAFSESVIITKTVLEAIAKHSHLAPLHNPANLQGIHAAMQAFPTLPHVAVFDTAFHQSMPQHAFMYALPQELYAKHGVRRYGFHGSSHRFVTMEAARMLDKPVEQCNIISAHLGNGCSVCAIRGGQSVDTSMGMTPLEGLVMGTRSGDVDPSLPHFLEQHLGYSAQQVNDLYNKESGLLGISGISNDCRTLEQEAESGDARAQLALDIFCYRLAKYVAAYMVPVAPLDALVLTGGIGENSSYIRERLVNLLTPLGFTLNHSANSRCRFGVAGPIQASESHRVLVIPTNEEWVIATDAARLASH